MSKLGLAILALIVGGFIALSGQPASAFPVAPQTGATPNASSPLVVDVKHGYHRGGYNRGGYYRGYRGYYRPYHRHGGYYGRRCAYWASNCRYRYRGYYYPYRWWVPGVGVGVAVASSNYYSKHKAWCANHYRSYNPRTNTWISKSGKVRKCVSPYRG